MNKKLLSIIGIVCLIALVGAIQITNFYLGEPWDISNTAYDNISFLTNQDGAESGINGYGITFNTDGTMMFMVSGWNNNIYSYTLSTAWDLSTMSYDSISKSLTSEDTTPNDAVFNTDGTKMYISGRTNKHIYQYTLSTAWNISTATYDSINFSISQASQPEGMFFKPDGTKMYIIDYGTTEVYQYSLSTAWNLSTASYDSISYGVSYNYGLCLSNDGTKMYTAQYNGYIVQYTLSTAWDLSTATSDTSILSGFQDENPYDIAFKPDGKKMYMLGYDNKKVFQYSVGSFITEDLTFSSNINISRNFSIPHNTRIDSATINVSGIEIDLINSLFTDPTNSIGLRDSNGLRGQKINLTNVEVDKLSFRWRCNDGNCEGNIIYQIRNESNTILGSCDVGIANKSTSEFRECDFEPNVSINGINYLLVTRDYDDISNDITIYINDQRGKIYGERTSSSNNGSLWNDDASSEMVIDTTFVGGLLYPNNPYIQINNTKIWNITGEFSTTQNKTNDFASVLNSALNGGLCDCTGCVLSGNYCNLTTIFHSDTAGKIFYEALDIQYTPAPFPTLESLNNNTYAPATKTFNCSATDEEGLSNITFYFWNSTGHLNITDTQDISNTYNSTTYDMVFNSTGTWTWGCSAYNNNSRRWWADDNFTINVDIDDPIIILNKPTDLQYINTANVQLNYTPEHSSQTVEACELYSNFTETWSLNQSDFSITEDVINSFNQTLSEGYYLWNIKCNTTETSNPAFATSNFTFTLDTTLPVMNNMTITTTADSTQFNFTTNISDTNLDSCKYSVWTGTTPGTNTSFTCNTTTTPSAPGFGTYILVVWATDSANNENSQNLSFTTSITTGGVVTGGGGSTTTITIAELTKGWTMGVKGGGNRIDASMPQGTQRTFKNIEFINIGESSVTITLSCEDVDGSACQYVEFPDSSFELAKLKDTPQTIDFILNIPREAEIGDYQFNIKALDEDSRDGSVTMFLEITSFTSFQSLISKIFFLKTSFGLPYLLVFFIPFIIIFIIAQKTISKKVPLKPIWVILTSLILSIIPVAVL